MWKLRGVLCPVAAPFDHAGDVYPSKLRHNLARLARTRLAGYVLTAWEGEGALLSGEERRRVWELAREVAGDRPCIAATEAESVHETAALAKEAKELGCEGVLLRAAGEYGEAELFLRAAADRSELPVAVAVDVRRPLSARTAAEIAAHPNVAAVCYGGADQHWVQEFASAADPAKLWIGRESLWRAAWEAGSRTAVLALANAVPFHLLAVEEALRMRDEDAAEELIGRALEAAEIPERYGPAGLKAAIDLRGGYGGSPRLPLLPAGTDARADIERRLGDLVS